MTATTAHTILAIDAATGPCSAALIRGCVVVDYRESTQRSQQAGTLIPMIQDMLRDAHISYNDIDLVACTVGPGSFTGIRIGLAAARGIAFAAGIATAGYTTLETMAFGCTGEHAVVCVLNAGKGDVYSQVFSPSRQALHDAQLSSLDVALKRAADSGAQLVCSAMPIDDSAFTVTAPSGPRADHLGLLAASGATHQSMQPFYIRPPDAKLPSADKKLRRLT